MSETVIVPDAINLAWMILELDELWSFVTKKTSQAWIWIALCQESRQVVAYAIGDRSQNTCRRLWDAIPLGYRLCYCFTDFWAAYQAVIPEEQHTAAGKETGKTAHVERWNNTLRQRLARFVRKTLSFSKSLVMHEACLKLFLHRHNRERAITLMPTTHLQFSSGRGQVKNTAHPLDVRPQKRRHDYPGSKPTTSVGKENPGTQTLSQHHTGRGEDYSEKDDEHP